MNKTNAAIVRTLLLGTSCLSVFAVDAARAQPTGGSVALGSATITNPNANSTVINQTTGKLIINWDSFSIAAGGRVQFKQPDASSIALNRILGADPTSIYGSLLANGQVWIVNGNGVLFGQGSRIAVGGLIATTSDIADSDFASGNYSFSGGTGATVTNQGTIRTGRRGYAVLSGASASNQGLIAANTGTVVIGGASAFTVDFQGDGLLSYAITTPAVTATNGQTGASNSGTIQGGRVVMTARAANDVQDAVVNNTGMISANSARVQNGEVILDGGDGDVSVAGTIDAKGTDHGTSGGSVTITGNNITVADNTQIDVSGRDGGGTVKIGGDLNGGGTIPHAANVTVGAATIKADATHAGDGGTVVVWSDGTTDFSGIVSAKGGSSGGNGGTVETAGQSLHVTSGASVDTSTLTGTTGNWLLGSSAFDISNAGGTLPGNQDPGQNGTIAPSTIAGSLPTTNMTFETGLDITVYDPIAYSAPNTLSLLAGGNIYIAADVQNAGMGAINVIAGWDGVTTDPSLFTASGVYGNFTESNFTGAPVGGGSVLVSSDYDGTAEPGDDEIHSVAIGSAGSTTTVAGDAVVVVGLGATSQIGYQGAGGGDIVVRSNTVFELGSTSGASAVVGNGLLDGSGSGDVTGNIDIQTTGLLLLGGDEGSTTWIGNLAGEGYSEYGNVTLIGASGETLPGADLSAILGADLVGGDFTLGFSDDSMPTGELLYNSPHNLTILASGDLDLGGSIVNDGTGAITLVAGWDGQTLDPGALTQDGAFGRDGASVYVGGTGGDTYVGSEGGTTTVLTGNLYLDASTGNAQIGYHGAGGGDISITALGDVELNGGDPTNGGYAAMIGNGTLDTPGTDAVTGNISLSVGGTLTLATTSGEDCECDWSDSGPGGITTFIGNSNALGGGPASGNLVLLAGAVDDSDDANGTDDNGHIARLIAPDLANGDVTLGIANSYNLTLNQDIQSGDHSLTLLTGGDITIESAVQAGGSGAITLVAGWDGTYDPSNIGASGTYGVEGAGTITIGGNGAGGDARVGTAEGDTRLYGANLYLYADNGVAQLGYHGAGGGNIVVGMTGDIIGSGGGTAGYDALLGNGSLDGEGSGNVTGNITLSAGNNTYFFNNYDDETNQLLGRAWLGNVASEGYTESGDVTALTRGGFFRGDFLTADLGTAPGTGGNVFVGFTDPAISPITLGGLHYNSANAFTWAAAGSLTINGVISNSGAGAITLVSGWDGYTVGSAADIKAAGAYGLNGDTLKLGGSGQNQDISVGSAGGVTTLLGNNVTLASTNGHYTQVGYHGAGSGEIDVFANGNLTLSAGSAANSYAMIGNGSRNGDVTSNVSGKIDVEVDFGDTIFSNGTGGARAWLGNVTGGSGKASGDVTVITDFGGVPNDILIADLGTSADTGGNVFFGYTDPNDGTVTFGGLTYNSPHNFTIASPTDLVISSSIQNAGSGEVTVVAGWDEHTVGDSAALIAANAYGLHNSTLTIVGNNTAVGSAGGLTTALATNIVLGTNAGTGFAQIGYHGAGTGDIQVSATGDLTLHSGSAEAAYAVIGNGTPDLTASVSGNITVQVAGTTSFVLGSGTDAVGIGNYSNGSSSGNVTLITGDLGNLGSLDSMLSHDLTGGDVTLAITDSEATTTLTGTTPYNSTHVLDLLAAGSLTIAGNIQNAGTGAVNLVAGWNGTTFDPAHFTDAGVYGNNSGTLTIGGASAPGAVAVGSAGGTTTALGYDVDVSGVNGFTQLGYAGNSSGDIVAMATHDVSVTTSGSLIIALIGNGGYGPDTNNVSGDVSVTAGHSVFVTAGGANTAAKIGNGQIEGVGTVAGNITVTALTGDVALSTAADTSRAQIGNGFETQSDVSGSITVSGVGVSLATGSSNSSVMIGNSGSARMTGDILIDATDVSLLSAWDSSSTQIGNGGSTAVDGALAGSILFGGSITINATNSLSLTTSHPGAGAWIGNGGDGSAMGLTTSGALTYSGDIAVNVGTSSHAGTLSMNQADSSDVYIGNGGYQSGAGTTAAGGVSQTGDITVTVLGGTTHGGSMLVNSAGTGLARIGNGGAANGTIGGDIDIAVDGGLQFVSSNGGNAFAGHSAIGSSTETGDLTIVAQNLSGAEMSLAAMLGGGDALIEVTGSGPFTLGAPVTYNSSHMLEVLAAGNVVIGGMVQNAGSGAIDVVAGWNGTTTDPAHLGDAGVYGNDGGSILIGGAGAIGNASLGSAGGATNLYAQDLTLSSLNGYAQLGYAGSGTGPVNVLALGMVTLDGGGDLAHFAQIGTGSTFGTSTAAEVNVTAASIQGSGTESIDANDLSLIAGAVGNSDASVQIAVNRLTLATGGGSAYLTTPRSLAIASADLSGGYLQISAAGAITQTGAILSGGLNVSTSSGAITLTNAGNAFGALTVSTEGSDNASFTNSGQLTVAGADVGGTLSLTAGTSIAQTGAVQAADLIATANNGTIVLNNAGNAFSRLAVSTTGGNDASVVDSTGFQLDTSNVGGTLTFLAGGTVTQPGTLHSGGLSASTTTGDLVLGDSGNAVSGTVVFHSAGSAYFNDTLSIAVGPSTAGGLLTLVSGGGISQSGAIQAGSLAVTAHGGDIALNDTGNSFATLRVSASGNASVTDASALTVDGATVNGALTLVGASINQSGAIQAASLSATATNAGIVLNDSRNSFATLSLATSGTNAASVTDSTGVTLAGANVGGTLTLLAGGAVGQSAALHSSGLIVTTTTGDIVLTNASNAVSGTVAFTTPGAASFADTLSFSMGQSSVGGLLTLVSGGGIGQSGAITAAGLNATANGGSIALGSSGNSFATLTVAASGDATVSDATAVSLGGANVAGAFTLAAGGAITQTGAISSGSLNVSTTTGAITLTNAGNAFGGLTVTTHGSDNASFAQTSQLNVASANVGGTLSLIAGTAIGQTGAITAASLSATANSGDIVLTNASNAVSGMVAFTTPGAASFTDTSPLNVGASSVGGLLTLVSGGGITQSGAIAAGGLSATANGGSIVLGSSGNAFSTLTLAATGSATVADSTGVTLGASMVGGSLTLTAGGTVGQSGALQSVGLSVTTSSGDIVLTNAANAVSGMVAFNTPGAASFTDTASIGLGASSVGGLLTLVSAGGISQTGAVQAASLNATANGGGIVLTNSGNSFATLALSTANDASVTDSTGVTLAASSIGGKLTLAAGGAVGQSGALHSTGLNVSTTSGAIALTNTANSVSGAVQFSTPGAVTFYDTLDLSVGASTVGGDLVLLSKGNVGVIGAVQSNSGAITIVAGWDGATTNAAQFGTSGVYGNANGSVTVGGTGATGNAGIGSKSGTTTVYAANLSILGTNGSAQLGYHGAGGGAIKVVALHNVTLTAGAGSALLGNGSLGNDVSGAVTGDIDVRLGGTIAFAGSANGKAWLGNAAPAGGSETGNLILVANDESTDSGTDLGSMIVSALGGGDVTLGFTGTGDQGSGKNYSYNSSHTFSYLAAGNLVFAASIQNAGSGAINLVAGWDGHTLTPSSFGQSGVYGNNGKGVTIGGANATGGVAVGSAGSTTSVYGASLLLAAANGYAQLGFNGHGAGAIAVTTTGAVTLTGGASAGDFAQIGNGGLKTSGNNSGDILITAGGDIVLTGGAGSEAYVQIGHGGAESNTGANGYSNTGAITLTAADLTLGAGTGSAAYAQVGQGGYESGLNLAGGQALNGGNITVTVGHLVSLTGNGGDAYAQIGNGGSQGNLNPSATASGTDSGDINVSAPNGSSGGITLTSGAGANAYSQIGNGGYAVNAGVNATVANFTVTGNVTVTDLALTGGGTNGYSVIGGGDASHNSVANVIGNIVIDANGNITYTAGTGAHSQATIGNFTGKGTVSGTLTGANPPPEITNDPGTIGVIVSSTANAKPNTNTAITTITTTVVSGEEQNGGASSLTAHIETAPPGPLASLGGGDSSAPNTSDNATVVIADSLDGAKKAAATQTIVAGMLSQSNPTSASHTVHAIPPADQDFSSWGNEALWQ